MSTTSEVRYFDYVNAGYERVLDVLRNDAPEVCRAATKTAASRAATLASELRINVGGFEIGTEVIIKVTATEERPADAKSPRATTFSLEWEAAHRPRFFPLMHAKLAVYPITATETQLELVSRYDPPFGAIKA